MSAREARTHPRAQTKPALEFLGEWGTKGGGPGQLQKPIGLATDSAGSVYLTDQGNNFIHKFSALGEPLLSFQDPLVADPGPLAVDSGGAIYVSSRSRIFIFMPTGERLREQRRGGGRKLQEVAGLATDGDGNLFVADTKANQVVKFDAQGRLRKVWGKLGTRSGEFHSPFTLAVGADGFVYVIDLDNSRIQKFTREGGFVSAWVGGDTGGRGLKNPLAIAVNEKFAFVTDSGTLVHVMTLDGLIRHTEDLSARVKIVPNGRNLTAIALAGKDELLVLDTVRAKVLRFRINL